MAKPTTTSHQGPTPIRWKDEWTQHVPPQLDYVWDQGAILVLLLGWIGWEWLLRRFSGLL